MFRWFWNKNQPLTENRAIIFKFQLTSMKVRWNSEFINPKSRYRFSMYFEQWESITHGSESKKGDVWCIEFLCKLMNLSAFDRVCTLQKNDSRFFNSKLKRFKSQSWFCILWKMKKPTSSRFCFSFQNRGFHKNLIQTRRINPDQTAEFSELKNESFSLGVQDSLDFYVDNLLLRCFFFFILRAREEFNF